MNNIQLEHYIRLHRLIEEKRKEGYKQVDDKLNAFLEKKLKELSENTEE